MSCGTTTGPGGGAHREGAPQVRLPSPILTFATARPAFLKMAPEAWQAEINKTPLKRRAEYKRSVIEHGASEFAMRWRSTTCSWQGWPTR